MACWSKTARLLAGLAGTLCLLAGGATARADPISIQYDLTGLPAAGGGIYVLSLPQENNTLPPITPSGGGSVGTTLDTAQNQGIVNGSKSDLYAAPVAGGTANAPALWSTPYFSTGIGSITLTFSQPQSYFGLLWGSVDIGNSVSFYGVTPGGHAWVTTISGNDIYRATESSAPVGSQGYGGSYYIGLQDSVGTFDKVVLSSSVVSFEAADIQYADSTVSLIGIPEPSTVTMLGSALLGLFVFSRRRGSWNRSARIDTSPFSA